MPLSFAHAIPTTKTPRLRDAVNQADHFIGEGFPAEAGVGMA